MLLKQERERVLNFKWKMELAWHAREFIQAKIKEGHSFVRYGELMEEMGIDRFTLGAVLGIVQYLDTMLKAPLHSALVGYSESAGEQVGEPAQSFYDCAEWLGHDLGDDPEKFMRRQRRQVRELCGVRLDA